MQTEQAVRVLLIGPPGAGKGTQAEHLTSLFKVPHISTGDMLREQIRKGSSLGAEAARYITDGNLVPDELIFSMLKARLSSKDTQAGYVLDGFPRSATQAVALGEFLGSRDEQVTAAILLVLDDELIIGRLSHRRVCPECGRVYHLTKNPPASGDRCDNDVCDSALVQRPDDNEVSLRNRLEIYHGQTSPVVAHYRAQGLLQEIDASAEISKVQKAIEDALEGKVTPR